MGVYLDVSIWETFVPGTALIPIFAFVAIPRVTAVKPFPSIMPTSGIKYCGRHPGSTPMTYSTAVTCGSPDGLSLDGLSLDGLSLDGLSLNDPEGILW